jgi:trk system potassium uptake protein
MKAVLSNMGFVMQLSGIMVIIPVVLAFMYNETSAIISLLITVTAFLSLGFLLNALAERKDLSFKESSCLIVFVFVFLSLIGSIPYWYIGLSEGSVLERISDGIFESTSGFTTTGFSVIPDLSLLPRSIVFYRSLTQFIGGIGIVLVLLAFFYPDTKLQEFSRSLGFPENHRIKKTVMVVLLMYLSSCFIMVLIGWLSGMKNIVSLASLIFSALSTGGFSPVNDLSRLVSGSPLYYILIATMVIGASNFFVLAGLFKFKIKEFLFSEVSLFILLMIVSIGAAIIFFSLSFVDSVFHVVSAMTTTGFSYLSLSGWAESLKLFFTALMFVGGTSLSTAGGIKIFRLVLVFKATQKVVTESITKQKSSVTLFGKEYYGMEILQALVVILLMAGTIFASTLVLSLSGFDMVDALFESTSALANTGLSVGIAAPSLAMGFKWMFIFIMLIGRVEILAFLIMLSHAREITKL